MRGLPGVWPGGFSFRAVVAEMRLWPHYPVVAIRVGGRVVTAKFVMFVLAVFCLTACETATKDDVTLQSDVGPAPSTHDTAVRGAVVADPVAVPARASRPVSAPRVARVVPNPMKTAATTPAVATATTSAPAVATTTPVPAPTPAPTSVPAAPTEPAQLASETVPLASTAEPPAEVAQAPLAPPTDITTPAHEPIVPLKMAPSVFEEIANLTPEKIEAMVGMPFMLIAAILAALVASFGLAIRPANKRRAVYVGRGDHDDHSEHREPYAA